MRARRWPHLPPAITPAEITLSQQANGERRDSNGLFGGFPVTGMPVFACTNKPDFLGNKLVRIWFVVCYGASSGFPSLPIQGVQHCVSTDPMNRSQVRRRYISRRIRQPGLQNNFFCQLCRWVMASFSATPLRSAVMAIDRCVSNEKVSRIYT